MNILHVYPQTYHHDDVKISGTREALVSLRIAITAALSHSIGKANSFINDGEGYTIHIERLTDDEMKDLTTPYTDV